MAHDIDSIILTLNQAKRLWKLPVVSEIAELNRDPFRILISTIISLRTKDEVTRAASERLYALADRPETLMLLDPSAIEKAIYPAGFYRNKAKTIIEVCTVLVNKYDSVVPDDLDELLKLKGVGRKTANLVITVGYNKPGICVDTHVHRISNRLGLIKTKTPTESEFALMEKLPQKYWIEYNDMLVAFGQNLCKPISPLCSECPIHEHCKRVGVTTHR